ncbi:hypothetical protein MOW14_14660 (plasmid) [Acinetobacter indicus]|uniref:hypothetical protein n=1 Tax=Acinetobacter indicus TaxID=756892 RepID=UPI001FA73E7B|nr:hypothetical protein [Acinetobacter indicus]UNW11142.1 hypothetical protein MOW14_14660 [Acinetobacter indicus]
MPKVKYAQDPEKVYGGETKETLRGAIDRYKGKKQSKSVTVNFYIAEDDEREAYEKWKSLPNKKQFILDALKKHTP